MYQTPVDPAWFAVAGFISLIVSLATPPVSGGTMICLNIMLSALGIPLEGLAVASVMALVFDFISTGSYIAMRHMEMVIQAGHLNLLDITRSHEELSLQLFTFCYIIIMGGKANEKDCPINGWRCFMEVITVPMKIPEGMAPFLEDESSEQRFQRNAMFLYSLIQDQRISYGRAAEILGVSKWSLIEFFNQMGMPYLNQTKSDLLEELRTYDRLKEQRA